MLKRIDTDSQAGFKGDREGEDILPLTRELCEFFTGVVTDGNDGLLARLAKELPFEVHRYPSGSEHLGWTVPQSWHVERALLKRDGAVVFDGTVHPLGVGMCSKSFSGTLSREALEPYLVTNADQPDAYMFHSVWQVRSWDAEWRLCIPHEIYATLGPGMYEVDLVTTFTPGAMPVAVYDHVGETDDVIVFTTNICHPTQANDGFCAVATLVRLFQWLQGRSTRYSYRLVLGPEHLGPAHYLHEIGADEIDRIRACCFMEMPGNRAPLVATSTFIGDQEWDHVFDAALASESADYRRSVWRHGCGNDETVWEAPGHEVPTIELTRAESPDYPYPEYHSSNDTADLMDPAMVDETLAVLKKTIDILEANAVMTRHFDGLICLSHPDYDLYFERHDPTIDKGLTDDDEKWGRLLDFLLRYFDGETSILDIATRHDLPFDRLRAYLQKFEDKGMVSFSPKRLDRPATSRATPRP